MQVQLSCKYAAQYNLIQIHFAVFQWIVENHCAVFQYNFNPQLCYAENMMPAIHWILYSSMLHFKSTQECGAPIQLKPDAWLLTSIFILSKEACPIQWLNTNCSPSNSFRSPSFTIQHKCKYVLLQCNLLTLLSTHAPFAVFTSFHLKLAFAYHIIFAHQTMHVH